MSTIEDHAEKIKHEAFIKDYVQNVGNVKEETLREFLKAIEAGDDYMTVESGSHIMDCWQLWNSAREPLIKDLIAAIHEHIEFSSNYTVWTKEHEFNKFEKMAELGVETPEWSIAMDTKAALEHLMRFSDDAAPCEFPGVLSGVTKGSYGDDLPKMKIDLRNILLRITEVTSDDLVETATRTFGISEKLTELGYVAPDDSPSM